MNPVDHAIVLLEGAAPPSGRRPDHRNKKKKSKGLDPPLSILKIDKVGLGEFLSLNYSGKLEKYCSAKSSEFLVNQYFLPET